MSKLHVGPSAREFIWASGIEDSFVPQTRPGHRSLDEYELMGHYEHWREDLKVARDLGIRVLRWGVPWYRVEPSAGQFDWAWVDQVLDYLVHELGITPIIDLMHYGCPFWLRREFANEQYPEAVGRYTEAFVQRYRGLVDAYTPLNEPLVNALMCGKRGLWPPYLRGDSGYVKIMIQLVKGVLNSCAIIKELDPGATLVHVEATGLNRAAREDLEVLAVEDQRRGYLYYDLLTGKVTPAHPLFGWLVRCGASPNDLATVARRRIQLDVMGMNFYPQWSTRQVYVTRTGRLAYRPIEMEGAGFAHLIEDYYHRYQVPILITETSANGSDEERSNWLRRSTELVKQLRGRGIPVIGYTWFPMFTMIDWRYRYGRQPAEHYRIELGLYKLQDVGPASRWAPTPLVRQLTGYMEDPENSVGELKRESAIPAAAAAAYPPHAHPPPLA